MMSREWWNLQDRARESLLESLQWNIDSDKYESFEELEQGIEISDIIFETADSMVPVYYSELLDLAADNNNLATDEPELGPASGSNFDGSNSPVNIIAANVFEALESDLWDYWRELESDDSDLTFIDTTEEERKEFARDAMVWFSKAYSWPPCLA